MKILLEKKAKLKLDKNILSVNNSILNSVLGKSEEGVCILDLEQCYIFFNECHEFLMSGLKKSTIKKDNYFFESFEDSKIKDEFEFAINAALDGEEIKFQHKIKIDKNNYSLYENIFMPALDNDNYPIGVIIKSELKVKNLTEHNFTAEPLEENFLTALTANANLADNSELLHYAMNSLSHGIVITDKDGAIVWCNNSVTEITGYEQNELIGKTPKIFKSYVHDDDFYEHLWQTIISGQIWKGEIVNRKKDDTFYFEELVITPVFNKLKEVTHYIAFKQDITNKRQTEKDLEKSEASLSLIIEKVPAVLWMVDADLMFVSSQGAGLKHLNLQPNQVVGTTLFDFFQTTDKNHPPIKAHQEALQGKSVNFKLKILTESYDVQVEPLRNANNQIIGCVGIAHNVTDRVKYENALIESREKAELSSKLKSEFLAQMSHEIRTPLNVIMSSASLLEEEMEEIEDDNESISTSFQLINSAGKRIIRTIDLLLNMSEIHSGSYDFVREEFDLNRDVLEQVYENYLLKAKSKGLAFNLSCQTGESKIVGDRYSVLEIFSNLVDNAIKYTEEGSIEIIIDKDEENNLAVLVVDTGIGISKDYLPNLFDKFSQEDEGYTRKFEGNGLGLALVKEYCTLNKATIEVESDKGKGSIFKVLFLT